MREVIRTALPIEHLFHPRLIWVDVTDAPVAVGDAMIEGER